MKKGILFSLLLVSFLVVPLSVDAFTIDDTGDDAYWGGTVQNAEPRDFGDVIGAGFDVDGLDATTTDGLTSITLTGEYFSNYKDSTHMAAQYAPGDLYISTSGWTVDASQPNYTSDTFNSQAEGWNYVLSFKEDADGGTSATGGLYKLTGDYVETNYGGTGRESWGYRSDQAWRGGYDPDEDYVCDVTVTLDGNTLTFTFNSSDFLLDLDNIGYHWTMLCGNDIVEGGGTPIPEPATMFLLGFGLLGLGLTRRKNKG